MSDKELDDVYYDRNLIAIVLAKETDYESGWKPDPESPDEWGIVCIETEYGQVSWHVPQIVIPDTLPQKEFEYDGYDREEKNYRMLQWKHEPEVAIYLCSQCNIEEEHIRVPPFHTTRPFCPECGCGMTAIATVDEDTGNNE